MRIGCAGRAARAHRGAADTDTLLRGGTGGTGGVTGASGNSWRLVCSETRLEGEERSGLSGVPSGHRAREGLTGSTELSRT